MEPLAPPKPSSRNVKWLDGLRGLASVTVVLTHLARTFDYDLFYPSDTEDSAPRVMQWPFIRLLWQGRIGLTLFAVLMGYVCALKPLRLLRSGDKQVALAAIAKSALMRPFRIVLPALLILTLQWVIAQFSAFEVAHSCDSAYMRDSSVHIKPTLREEIHHWWIIVWTEWTNGRQDYDDHHWALLPLLNASFDAYLVLAALVFTRYSCRIAAYMFCFFYFWQDERADKESFPAQVFVGILLCDMSMHQPTQNFLAKHVRARRILAYSLIIGGLYLASYPAANADWQGWSRELGVLEWYLFPKNSSLPKRFTAFGVDMIMFGITLSPTIKELLSTKPMLWLGRYSFSVYLVHGTLLRTVLVWMIYGVHTLPESELSEEHYLPRAKLAVFFVAIPIWFAIVYECAHLWSTYVDSFCTSVTKRIEDFLLKDEDELIWSDKNGLIANGQ